MGVRWAVLAVALSAGAQNGPDPTATLNRARDNVLAWRARLRNYTCVETVDRTYYRRERQEAPPPDCDRMMGERDRKAYKLVVEATDRLRLDVKVSQGSEIGSWAGASHFQEQNMAKLVRGPFGTGPFGTLLGEIFIQRGVNFEYAGQETVNGKAMLRYRFQVPAGSSHYMVDLDEGVTVTAYSGDIWIEPATCGLRRLEVRTAELPPRTGTCEAATTVDYAERPTGSGDYLLAQGSDLRLLLRDTREDDVKAVYTNCREFMGEAKLVAGPEDVTDEAAPKAAPAPIAPGLKVELALAAPIDSDTAAAGDRFEAQVKKDVRAADGTVAMRAGVKVRGRIVTMEHHLGQPPYFRFGLELEAVETAGGEAPIYAMPGKVKEVELLTSTRRDLQMKNPAVYMRPAGEPVQVMDVVIPSYSRRHVMRMGYAMSWMTGPGPME